LKWTEISPDAGIVVGGDTCLLNFKLSENCQKIFQYCESGSCGLLDNFRNAAVLAWYSFDQQVYLVTNWMGDCLQRGKLFQFITDHPSQLSFLSLQVR